MTTYLYETIPADENEEPVRFEYRQSMKDEPLKVHPETGQPVRRVILGGYGILKSAPSPQPEPAQYACGVGCCCHGNN